MFLQVYSKTQIMSCMMSFVSAAFYLCQLPTDYLLKGNPPLLKLDNKKFFVENSDPQTWEFSVHAHAGTSASV